MNGNNFESMIKKYADELIKMSREKALPDLPEETPVQEPEENFAVEEESELLPFEEEKETDEVPSVDDISNAEDTVFYEETAEEISPEEKAEEMTDYAIFSARVFTGNNAYPIENAKVMVVKDDRLYTFLTTDRDGTTKKLRLPSFPESNSLDPDSEMQAVNYTGEVYATGFTPKKGLLIEAVGGSDIVLEVQMTPISAEVN